MIVVYYNSLSVFKFSIFTNYRNACNTWLTQYIKSQTHSNTSLLDSSNPTVLTRQLNITQWAELTDEEGR